MITDTNSPLSPARGGRRRIQPLVAWRAIRALIADQEDTAQVFKVIHALEGNAGERLFRRFSATPVGGAILREKCDLLSVLSNQETLAEHTAGTLGHTYYQFMTAENLTASGLVEASEAVPHRRGRDEDHRRFGNRMRDSHDLWHCVTGYGRDALGELCLLAFTYAQTRNRGLGAIVFFGALEGNRRHRGAGVGRAVREGYRLGRKASWLPAANWERLLSRPLAEVREELKIGELQIYRETLARIGVIDAATVADSTGAKVKLAA